MTNPNAGSNWGVVGGGVLGMTLALRLAEAGHDVTLYEAAPEVGGLASAWQLGDLTWDRHYHVTLLSDGHWRKVMAELGLDDRMEWVETRTGCYADGTLYSVSNSVEFLKFPPLRLVDKLRLGWTVFHASRLDDWEALEQQSVEEWLVKHSGRRTFDSFWLPLLRSKLGDNYKAASAAFIWAVIQRLYAARRSGLKREMFGYLPGGYATALARFSQVLEDKGVTIRLGTKVEKVARDGSTVAVHTADGASTHNDVVVTTASPVAARIIDGLSTDETNRLDAITYQGIVCASAVLTRPLSPYYVTNITDDGFPFTGVIEMSALVDRREFNGNSLVYLPYYVPIDDPFMEADDETVRATSVEGLKRMHPDLTDDEIVDFKVSRVKYVLPISTIGYSKGVPPIATSVPGVHLVNSSQIVNGTLNVNETVQLAEQSVPHLLAAAGAAKVAQ